jgi:hypothetical protein
MFEQHIIFGEILSLPTLFTLSLLLVALRTKRNRPAVFSEKTNEADKPGIPPKKATTAPPRTKTNKTIRAGMLLGYAAVVVYWFGTVGFDVTPTVITLLVVTIAASFLLNLFYFKSARRWLFRFGKIVLFLLLALSSGLFLPTILWGLSITISLFFLYLALLLIADYLGRQIVRLRRTVLPAGSLLPLLVLLFWMLLSIGPFRIWQLPPRTMFKLCPEIAHVTILIMIATFCAVLIQATLTDRKKLIARVPALWLSLLLSAVFAVYLSAAAYRFDTAACHGIWNNAQLAHFQETFMVADSAFDDNFYYIAEKEPRRLKKFDKRGRLIDEIKLNIPPNEIVLDRQSGLLFVIAVDIYQAPLTVIDTRHFEIFKLINLSDDGWPLRLLQNEKNQQLTVFVVSNSENLFLIDTATATIIAKSTLEELHERRMTGVYDKFNNTFWLTDFIGRELLKLVWNKDNTVSLEKPGRVGGHFYLTHALLPISPEKMLISRLLDPGRLALGKIQVYNSDSMKPLSEIDLPIVRFFDYNPRLDVLFAVSLADDSLHTVDLATGSSQITAYLGPQPRNIHVNDDDGIILCSKCGAFLHLPRARTEQFGSWDDEQLSNFALFGYQPGKMSTR